MLAFPNVQVLDVTGPLEVFSRSARWLRDNGHRKDLAYEIEIIGVKRGWFRTSSGLRLYAERAFSDVSRGIDTLMIAGGFGVEAHRRNAALLRWIRQQATRARRLASICRRKTWLVSLQSSLSWFVSMSLNCSSELARPRPCLTSPLY